MAAVRTSGRPLPQPPQVYDREAAWYEHEERMRPSYIAQPAYQQQAFFQPSSPPVSPSARWASSPQKQQQQQQQYFPQQYAFPTGPADPAYYPTGATSRFKRDGGPSLSNPTPYVAGTGDVNATVRPRMSTIPSSRLASPQASGARGYAQVPGDDAGMRSGTAKGSAFMHKGFWDIMSLVNNPQGPPGTAGGPSRFKQTFSKATGGLKKVTSNTSIPQQASPDDLFFSAGGPPLSRPSPLAPLPAASNQGVSQQQVQQRTPSPASFYTADSRNQASTATAPNINGPRAQKKRISVDMVGKPQGFIHAAHASDAEQAEAILRRWGRDGVGKVADPAWIERCKEAMRVQAARNQAEAIAQIQAALHQESIIKENERPPLHIVNGAPSQSATTASTMTSTTVTAGHGTISTEPPRTPGEGRGFPGIQEEVSGEYTALTPPLAPALSPSPRRPSPVSGASSPPPAARPNMMPRSNTGGTMVVNPSPDVAAAIAQDAPDYLLFKPAKGSPTSPTTDKRASKAGQIDGLPGGAAGINALFDNRPTSMVVRDSAAPLSSTNLAAAVTPKQENRTLAGEELNATLAANAGAAMRPSLTTVEKSVAAKIFFENLYYGILKKPRDRDTRRAGLEAELASLRIPESAKDEIRAAWMANETEYLRDIRARVNVNSFIRLKTIGHGAFGVVALIKERGTGELFAMKQLRKADMLRKGQEGHVRAERDLMTSASASASAKWIVKLVYSFQDVDHLYLIMEFMGGGDLLNLLIEKDIFAEDFARFYVAEMILSIHEAHRLGYIHRDIKPDNFLFTSQGHIKLADFGLCQSFHWAHDGAYYDQQRRNLLKKHGIDLEDSTAAKRAAAGGGRGTVRGGATATTKGGELNDKELNDVMSDRNEDGTPLTHVLTWRDKNKKKIAYSVVGTNNYMAPEVLRGYGYDQSCDWWSLGVIVFEMLWGYPPFVSKSRHLTRQKILNWRQTLKFPPRPKVSREAQDFISKLICERDDRLGSTSTASVSRPNSLLQGSRQRSGFAAPGASTANAGGLQDGVEDLMAHPWFRGIDWNSIHKSPAPFKPALSHPADTKHFEDDIEAEPLPAPGAAEAAKGGQPPPVDAPRDPMLRDKAQGQHLLEMRKQLAFVGYTFKSPKGFDPKAQLSESKIVAAERRDHELQSGRGDMLLREPSQSGSRLRSMSM